MLFVYMDDILAITHQAQKVVESIGLVYKIKLGATRNQISTWEQMLRSDKISTSLALDSLHKIRVSCVKNHVSARSDAQICFLS